MVSKPSITDEHPVVGNTPVADKSKAHEGLPSVPVLSAPGHAARMVASSSGENIKYVPDPTSISITRGRLLDTRKSAARTQMKSFHSGQSPAPKPGEKVSNAVLAARAPRESDSPTQHLKNVAYKKQLLDELDGASAKEVPVNNVQAAVATKQKQQQVKVHPAAQPSTAPVMC